MTASVGLSHNKFLAKIASDLDKPRGFSTIGKAETAEFLKGKPVALLWGVGEATRAALATAGIRTIDDLLRLDEADLFRRFGATGQRLWHLARGQDTRRVIADAPTKSISSERTFEVDLVDRELLKHHLWWMAEKVSDRAKAADLQGRTVTLKARRKDFSVLSRRITLHAPTQLADTLYRTVTDLLDALNERGPFRLIGIGLSDLSAATGQDPIGDLLDPRAAATRAQTERATDAIRARFGPKAITKGRGFTPE